MANKLEDRPAEIFKTINGFDYSDITLEKIMQKGIKELPDFDDFLTMWIEYLSKNTSNLAAKLMDDALNLTSNNDAILKIARESINTHPEIYKNIIIDYKSKENTEQSIKIALEAVDKIPIQYAIRSEIALLLADIYKSMNDLENMEKCWLEAFKSDCNPVNYLRIRAYSNNYEKYREEINLICRNNYSKKHNTYDYDMIKTPIKIGNCLSEYEYCAILFFEERFDEMIKIGMDEYSGIGWSHTFMKNGIALLFVLLYKGNKYPTCYDDFINRVEGLYTGDEITAKKFWEFLSVWKKQIVLSDEANQSLIKKLSSLIKTRVAAIMTNNRRNYYDECASFIAGLGEVLVSQGDLNAKTDLLYKYHCEYKRRSSFTNSLLKYGLKK